MTNNKNKVKAIFETVTNTFQVWLHTTGRRLSWTGLSFPSFVGVFGLFLTVCLRLFLLGFPLTRPSCKIVIFPSPFSTMKDNKMAAITRQVIFFMLCFSTRLRRYQQVFRRCFLSRAYVEVIYSQAGFGYHNDPQRLSCVVSSAIIKLSLRRSRRAWNYFLFVFFPCSNSFYNLKEETLTSIPSLSVFFVVPATVQEQKSQLRPKCSIF